MARLNPRPPPPMGTEPGPPKVVRPTPVCGGGRPPGVVTGGGGAAGAPASPRWIPNSLAIPRRVAGVTEKPAVTLVRNGENFAVSEPTAPAHRSCVIARLNPGRRSEANVLLSVWVVHPVRPESFACSKL